VDVIDRISSFTGIGMASPSSSSTRGDHQNAWASRSFSDVASEIDLTDELGIKADDQRRRNIHSLFMIRHANRLFNPKHHLVLPVIQFNTVRTAQQRAGDFFPSSTSRSMSVESRSVVAKTQTGKQSQQRQCRFS
jgi:hypothetical protein